MFTSRVISDEGLTSTAGGLKLDIRLPWYRSLPLSTVTIGELKIDGQTIDPGDIRFEVNGKTFALDELASHSEEWWFVLDSAYLHVHGKALEPRSEHEIAVGVGIKPPYIPHFYRLTECAKHLTAK
jgi:hypothetical protein